MASRVDPYLFMSNDVICVVYVDDCIFWERLQYELNRYFKSDGRQCDVVLRFNKRLYGQAKAAQLWYENLKNVFLDHGFVVSKVDPCLFMSKDVICVVYVDDCIFWESLQ